MSIVPTSAVCCEAALLTSVLLMGTSLNWVVARVTAQRARRAREVTGMAPWTARGRGRRDHVSIPQRVSGQRPGHIVLMPLRASLALSYATTLLPMEAGVRRSFNGIPPLCE